MVTGINQDSKQRQIVADAAKTHEWPPEAGECTMKAWDIYAKNQQFRAHADWIPGDLVELARMSLLQEMASSEMETWRAEGVIIYGGRHGNTPIENPRGRAVSTLNSTINSMMRRLGITGASSGPEKTKDIHARKEREAREKLESQDSSGRSKKRAVAQPNDFLN